jgi:hypothetical protein
VNKKPPAIPPTKSPLRPASKPLLDTLLEDIVPAESATSQKAAALAAIGKAPLRSLLGLSLSKAAALLQALGNLPEVSAAEAAGQEVTLGELFVKPKATRRGKRAKHAEMQRVVEFMQENEGSSVQEIAEGTGLSIRITKAIIEKIHAQKHGLVDVA